ncbi:hypothetical protein Tco_1299133, partial [Tanacetum coccineum]
IIAMNLDTSSNNSSSDYDNNTSDSASTSQISTSKEINYDSPEYKGPPKSLLKWYNYLSDEYEDNDSTDKDITNNDITDEDCIYEPNSAMSKGKYVPVSQKHNPKVKSLVPVTGRVLELANITTWDEIVNKMGMRKSKICANKAKEKRKVSYGSSLTWLQASIYRLHLQVESKHLQVATKHLQVATKHLQLAFARKWVSLQASICRLHLQVESKHLQVATKHLQLAFARKWVSLQASICINQT